jgi:hypothetical protein
VTRIYEHAGYRTRMNAFTVVIVIAVLFGCFEIWTAYRTGGDGNNYMFAAFFIGGAIYAGVQLRDQSVNTVVSLDVDPSSGQSVITLWRPFTSRTIAGSLDRLTDWQFQRRARRMPTPILTAHHPDNRGLLEFELKPGAPVSDQFRALAPEAIAAFDAATVT